MKKLTLEFSTVVDNLWKTFIFACLSHFLHIKITMKTKRFELMRGSLSTITVKKMGKSGKYWSNYDFIRV